MFGAVGNTVSAPASGNRLKPVPWYRVKCKNELARRWLCATRTWGLGGRNRGRADLILLATGTVEAGGQAAAKGL